MPKDFKVRLIVGAIIRKDDKFLLLRENKKGRTWGLPKGKVDGGEDLIAAVKREVKEETNLDFEPTGLLLPLIIRQHSEKGIKSIRFYFTGTWTGNMQAQNEIDAAGWRTLEEIRKMPRIPEIDVLLSHESQVAPLESLRTFITNTQN